MHARLCIVGLGLGLIAGASSVEAQPYGYGDRGPGFGRAPGCVAYEHADFGGARLRLRGDIPSLEGFWNDRISSIDCAPGCSVVIFEHVGFRGNRETIAGGVGYLGDFWNDRISSVAVRCGRY